MDRATRDAILDGVAAMLDGCESAECILSRPSVLASVDGGSEAVVPGCVGRVEINIRYPKEDHPLEQ